MIPGVMRSILGQGQFFGGLLMKARRPKYQIPGEVTEMAERSRMLSGGRMPGIQFAQDRIDQSYADNISAVRKGATSPTQFLAGLSALSINKGLAERGLAESEASDYYRREQVLRSSLGLLGQYKEKQWDYDFNQLYENKARTKAALMGAGLRNWFGGSEDVAGGYLMSKYYDGDESDYGWGGGAGIRRKTKNPWGMKPEGYGRMDDFS